MIPQRHHVDAVSADFIEQVGCDAAAAGDVLGVRDYQVYILLTNQRRQFLLHDLSARTTDDISQAKNPKGHVDSVQDR